MRVIARMFQAVPSQWLLFLLSFCSPSKGLHRRNHSLHTVILHHGENVSRLFLRQPCLQTHELYRGRAGEGFKASVHPSGINPSRTEDFPPVLLGRWSEAMGVRALQCDSFGTATSAMFPKGSRKHMESSHVGSEPLPIILGPLITKCYKLDALMPWALLMM